VTPLSGELVKGDCKKLLCCGFLVDVLSVDRSQIDVFTLTSLACVFTQIVEWNEWKCEDFKCVWKPTESRLCLTHYSCCMYYNHLNIAVVLASMALQDDCELGFFSMVTSLQSIFTVWIVDVYKKLRAL